MSTAAIRKRRTRKSPAPSTTAKVANSDYSGDAAQFDYDERVVYQVDASIWRAVWRGEFRLAVRCTRCGRWLTDGRSKKRHMGARCAARAGGEA